tara:strand:+ start:335 stop:649 length:315 start_codon:yes stop_codon:yes gene_type:complete
MPVEISGKAGNYVATWMEGRLEGDGKTEEAAVADLRDAIVEKFVSLRTRVINGHSLLPDQDQVWTSLLNYIVEVRDGKVIKTSPSDDYNEKSKEDEDYKGPFFG